MIAIFLNDHTGNIAHVYADRVLSDLRACVELDETVYTSSDLRSAPERFQDTEIIFSTWGMPSLTEEEIRSFLPRLRAVFYAAGSVQGFAKPFLACGVKVFSAWAANGVPVAEYTVAQIVLANKGFYQTASLMKSGHARRARGVLSECYPGNYGVRVGLIGCGMIGSMVAEMLKSYEVEVAVFDPFLSCEKAERLGVRMLPLDELFATCQVVSNHLANNAQTRGMLGYTHFSAMLPYATFLNTGRGAQVVEDDLVRALTERPDLTAVLDVTCPEPPTEGHPFYTLPNCVLTPHIAGSKGNEVVRMAAYMAQELKLYLSGKPCRYEVSVAMLETMA